jgi:hypothetical protein
MPTCGLAIITRGMVYPATEIYPVVADSPYISGVVEVKPRVLASIPLVPPAPAGEPTILSVQELRPRMGASGPTPPSGGETPKVLSALDLRPTIRKAEEE